MTRTTAEPEPAMLTTALVAVVTAATIFQVGYTVRLAVPLVRARVARR